MAGGPIAPLSVYLGNAAGNLFPNFYAGGGGNLSAHDEGIGVVASFAANFGSGTGELRFPMPPSIPTGTLKLRDLVLINATTGAAAFVILCGLVSAGGSPSAVTLISAGNQTISCNANTPDKYQETKTTIPLTPSANDMLVVALSMFASGYTLAAVATHIPTVIWE